MKKLLYNDILQLALVLSLLRVDPDAYLGLIPRAPIIHDLRLGQTWIHTQTSILDINNRFNGYRHPKSLDSVLRNRQEELISELSALGRYNRFQADREVVAYLLNGSQASTSVSPTPADLQGQSPTAAGSSFQQNSEEPAHALAPAANLTQEDVELIEILWKQDIDLGITRDDFDPVQLQKRLESAEKNRTKEEEQKEENEINRLKENLLSEEPAVAEETTVDPWMGFKYTIDSETDSKLKEHGRRYEKPEDTFQCLPKANQATKTLMLTG